MDPGKSFPMEVDGKQGKATISRELKTPNQKMALEEFYKGKQKSDP